MLPPKATHGNRISHAHEQFSYPERGHSATIARGPSAKTFLKRSQTQPQLAGVEVLMTGSLWNDPFRPPGEHLLRRDATRSMGRRP
jgi:hypothetical protein